MQTATVCQFPQLLMPTYEYSCQKCGQNFDAFQSMRDDAFTECPRSLCQQKRWGHGKVKRLLGSGAGLIFKGSGFYITDYRSNSYQEGAKKDAPKTEASDAKPAAKESKPAASEPASSKTSNAKKESAK